MKNKKNMICKLENMGNDDGMTLEDYKNITYNNGYQVGIAGVVVDNAEDAAKAIDLYNGNCGVWYSSGLYYIDQSVHIINKEDALTIAGACNQQSILKWDDMSLIWI